MGQIATDCLHQRRRFLEDGRAFGVLAARVMAVSEGGGVSTGRLVLCGTPIGNLDDATLRLVRVLGEADLIACEDPRRARKLLSHHSIRAPELVVYNEGNERRRAPELAERIRRGATVALISSAGMPAIADPGYRLVRAC